MKDKMQTKIIFILLTLIAFLVAIFQRNKIKDLNKEITKAEITISSIQKNTELNIIDLQKRNQELKNNEIIYKEQKDILQAEVDKISKINSNDCINQPINIDIVRMLQKSGI